MSCLLAAFSDIPEILPLQEIGSKVVSGIAKGLTVILPIVLGVMIWRAARRRNQVERNEGLLSYFSRLGRWW